MRRRRRTKRPPEFGPEGKPARGLSRRAALWGAVAAGALLGFLAALFMWNAGGGAAPGQSPLRLGDIAFDGAAAYRYLRQICAIGRRPSGSQGMERQQDLLEKHFTKLGAKVSRQRFQGRDPRNGNAVPMTNLLVQWHPDKNRRVLLAAHYDTLPFPMRDPKAPRGEFIGANDGGSGVALLMQLGHEIPKMSLDFGVDFVFFDGEEYVFTEDEPYFQGSEYFAKAYANQPPAHRYRWGVLLDMIGDANLRIFYEAQSYEWDDTRPLVEEIWGVAKRLGVREFVPRVKHNVRDDHLALHNIARIPTCDIIDFDYPPWHTRADTPERCSALSLAKVGWVVQEWLAGLRLDDPLGPAKE
jgi:glutaminyl-peptide cyclotransferase